MVWKPHLTVSAIIERDGQYLMIEEQCSAGIVINQPAGHLEDGESVHEAVIREVREETACDFEPLGLTGIYKFKRENSDKTFIRINYFGRFLKQHDHPLDDGILRAFWSTRDEIFAMPNLRSPMVKKAIDDYEKGQHLPLNIITEL